MSRRLKIGIVTGSASRLAGGLFNSVRRSALALLELGHDVDVLALDDEYASDDREAWAPLVPKHYRTRGPTAFGYAPALEKGMGRQDFDVIHQHGIWQAFSMQVSSWARRTAGPVMVSPRGMLDPWALQNSGLKKKLAGAFFENRNLQAARCLHALNTSEAKSMRDYGLKNPIAIIPNATDIPEISRRERRPRPRTLLFLGRIHPKKGLSQLVKAWALACRLDAQLAKEWRLQIAGWDDGGHAEAIKGLISELGLASSVALTGPVFGEQKEAVLRSADAFILPSFSEGLPMSVLEAWAYRLPVLMTAACNLPEGFKSGAAIKITTDPDALAIQLAKALLNTDLYPLGKAGRSLVQKQFSWPTVAVRHLEVYHWMVLGGEPPGCVRLTGA